MNCTKKIHTDIKQTGVVDAILFKIFIVSMSLLLISKKHNWFSLERKIKD